MKKLGVFITPTELDQVRTEQKVSGMFLSGGRPMGDPAAAVERLRIKYNMPEGTGLETGKGEFCAP